MAYKDIRSLMQKYFEGSSNIDEEKQLKQFFFEAENLPDDLEQVKPIFAYLKQAKNIKSERIHIFKPIIKKSKLINLKRPALKFVAAAAVILLIISVFMNINKKEPIIYAYINGKAITNEKIAELETEKALFQVSNQWNKGTTNLQYIEHFSLAEDKIKGVSKE